MAKAKQILIGSAKYLIMVFAVALGVTFDVDAAGSFDAFVAQLGLSDGALIGGILYLVWENKKKLERILQEMDEVKRKINKWDKE